MPTLQTWLLRDTSIIDSVIDTYSGITDSVAIDIPTIIGEGVGFTGSDAKILALL